MRPYRKERIANALRNIVSEAIAYKMHDPRVEPLTTVTRVDVTGDLQSAKVHLSVPGNEAAERRTMAAMRRATGYLQSLVAGQMQIRQCPELRFMIDKGTKSARQILKILDENREKHPELFESQDAEDGNPDESQRDQPAQADEPRRTGDHPGEAAEDMGEGMGG